MNFSSVGDKKEKNDSEDKEDDNGGHQENEDDFELFGGRSCRFSE